jgi:hypothetical protein
MPAAAIITATEVTYPARRKRRIVLGSIRLRVD